MNKLTPNSTQAEVDAVWQAIYGKLYHTVLQPRDISDPTDNSASPVPSDHAPAAAIEHCTYMGKRVRLISKNYQDGTATIEDRDITGPFTLTVKLADCQLESPNDGNKCSCGHDSLAPGNQGKHSNWCDKFFKY